LNIVLITLKYEFCINEPVPDQLAVDAPESEREYYKECFETGEMSRYNKLAAMPGV
jgi:hypothetical protein